MADVQFIDALNGTLTNATALAGALRANLRSAAQVYSSAQVDTLLAAKMSSSTLTGASLSTTGVANELGLNPAGAFVKTSRRVKNVKDYGAKGDGATNDRVAIQTALDDGAGITYAPAGTSYYVISGGSLTMASGQQLHGDSDTSGTGGTRFRRATAGQVLIDLTGISLLVQPGATGHIRYSKIRDICLDGGDVSGIILQCRAVASLKVENVFFRAAGGSQCLKTLELMDSRFTNCRFEYGGNSAGTVPAVELSSGSSYEYTNQVFFIGCVWESNLGYSVDITGTNTNECRFIACKMENSTALLPAIRASNANNLYFDVQISTGGVTGTPFDGAWEFVSCTAIKAHFTHEHLGGRGDLVQLGKLTTCTCCDIVHVGVGAILGAMSATNAILYTGTSSRCNVDVQVVTEDYTKSRLPTGSFFNQELIRTLWQYDDTPGFRVRMLNLATTGFVNFFGYDAGGGVPGYKFEHFNNSTTQTMLEFSHVRDVMLKAGLTLNMAAIAAAGTTQGAATAIPYIMIYSKITTATAASAEGLILPVGVTGKVHYVRNGHATVTCTVYPPTGGAIDNGSTNAGVTIAPGKTRMFLCTGGSGLAWDSALSA